MSLKSTGKVLALSLAIAGLSVSAANAATNLISNGSFEIGTDPGTFTTINPADPNITDWTVNTPNVDYIGTYWQAADGVRSLDLSGYFANGLISQTTAATDASKTYRLTFYVSANPDQALPDPRLATVFVNGNPTAISYDLDGNTKSNMKWEQRSLTFQGTGAPVTIGFSGAPNSNLAWGVALDNVSLVAVPEPATWAMMLVGFFGLGTALRSTRRARSLAAAA